MTPKTLTVRCPECERALHVPRAGSGTVVCDRTCRGCGQRWRVITRLERRTERYDAHSIELCGLFTH